MRRRTILLIVAVTGVLALLPITAVVVVTLQSGLWDQAIASVEDSRKTAQMREGSCLPELPRPMESDARTARAPEVVECDASNAAWVVDEIAEDVPADLFYRYLENGRATDSAAICIVSKLFDWYQS